MSTRCLRDIYESMVHADSVKVELLYALCCSDSIVVCHTAVQSVFWCELTVTTL